MNILAETNFSETCTQDVGWLTDWLHDIVRVLALGNTQEIHYYLLNKLLKTKQNPILNIKFLISTYMYYALT